VGVGLLYTLDNPIGEVGVSKHPDISDPYSLNFQNSVLADFLVFPLLSGRDNKGGEWAVTGY
jgi:hypothetical protein